MLFTFFVAWLIGISEHGHTDEQVPSARECLRPDPVDIPHLLRLLTPILKGSVCKRSSHVLQECMEALGGVGYLDNSENEAINIARLYRDCIVNSIWEGTTDVLATDTLRVLKGHSGGATLKALNRWIMKAVSNGQVVNTSIVYTKESLVRRWETLMGLIISLSSEELLHLARDLLFQISDVVMGVLLYVDVQTDESPASTQVLLRFLEEKGITQRESSVITTSPLKILELNREIVFGKSSVADIMKKNYISKIHDTSTKPFRQLRALHAIICATIPSLHSWYADGKESAKI
ncbi:hypothetical protein BDZ45DRAFT_742019 [Acephala macrosclerotiorum]|nr:hypothetical protein BDZ45DRAFT_742019 [Acephala macrosclerotiorum]